MADRTQLQTFDNPHPNRDYLIEHVAGEFTSLCPMTGQPDFGKVNVCYVPDAVCLELKALKLYFQSFRDQGIFYEDITNAILDDLVSASAPRWMQVQTVWQGRGGICSTITAEHGRRPG